MSAPRILVTGSTGFVGGAVAADLAARGLLPQCVFMVRAEDADAARARVHATLLRFGTSPAVADLLHSSQIVCGDLTGVEAFADHPQLEGFSHVLHCAALATFSNNPKIWASNVDGTLALARAVLARSRLTRWLQVGTAMCCGPGWPSPVQESWEAGSQEDAHLVPYTRSKLAVELALRELPGLPLVVARPSIVVGHSTLGCAPSPSIFWVFRMAFALERFTCAPDERIDIIPVDWTARMLVDLCLKPSLSHDLYHVCAGPDRSNTFTELDAAYAAATGQPPIAPRYQQVAVDDLRSLVPLFQERLGKVNRLLILRALTLYGAFAELNYVFDNQRLQAEGLPLPPALASYMAACVDTSKGIPMTEQMAYDFK